MSYFDCGLAIGQVISNSEIVEIYKCGNMGECVVLTLPARLSSSLTTQRGSITTDGLVVHSITLAWDKMETKNLIGCKTKL